MNYDISNLATRAEDDIEFSERDEQLRALRDCEDYWLIKAYEPEHINPIYLSRADWYFNQMTAINPFYWR